MFCHKCGNQSIEGAEFCNKCGTKFVTEAMTVEPVPAISPTAQQQQQVPVPTIVHYPTVDTGFKEFVDNHVRITTKFKSAEDLITNSKPSSYIWKCFAGTALAFLLIMLIRKTFDVVAFFALTAFFGYVAMFITNLVIGGRYMSRFCGEFTGDINIDDLIVFFNGHLKQISPNFHNWGYMSSTGGLLTTIGNLAALAVKDVSLCTEYGPKKKRLAVLTIRQNPDDPTAIRKYFVDAQKNGTNLDVRSNGMFGYSTLVRTAPILQATIEYYLKTRT